MTSTTDTTTNNGPGSPVQWLHGSADEAKPLLRVPELSRYAAGPRDRVTA